MIKKISFVLLVFFPGIACAMRGSSGGGSSGGGSSDHFQNGVATMTLRIPDPYGLIVTTIEVTGGSANNGIVLDANSNSNSGIRFGGANNPFDLTNDGLGFFNIGNNGASQFKFGSNEVFYMFDQGSGFSWGMQPPGLAANKLFTMPSTYGNSGDVLQGNGSGVLSFVTPSSGGGSTLAVTTGSATQFNGAITSSPTFVVVFDSNTFLGIRTPSTTAYISLNASSVTLQGQNVLLQSSAAATYANINNYLDKSSATSTYFVKTNNLAANQIASGTLGSAVIVTSVSVSGVTPGSYTNTNLTVGADGRITTVANGSAGGSSTLVVTTGSATQFNLPAVSSPTSTIVFSSNSFNAQSTSVSTACITLMQISLSTAVMGFLPTNSLLGQISLSTQVTGNLPLANMASPATYYIQNGTSLQSPAATLNITSGTILTLNTSTFTANASINGQMFLINNATGAPAMAVNTTGVAITNTAMFNVIDSSGRIVFSVNGNGHIVTIASAPVASSCGTSPTFSANSSDHKGTITSGATAGGCTITFANPYIAAPTCVVTERAMSLVNAMSYATSTTALTITETSSGGVVYDYLCEE